MITVGARKTKNVSLRISSGGHWEVRAAFEGKPISGKVEVDWRGWKITGGEVDATRSDTFAEEPFAVIVGGFGWAKPLPPKSYQDDRGIIASAILQPLAASINETLAIASDVPLGRYFMRRNETGGALLSRIFGVGNWHTGTDGIARTGPRTATIGKSVVVLQYKPRDNRVELYADRPDQCLPGSTIAATTRHRALMITDLVVKAETKERITAFVRFA